MRKQIKQSHIDHYEPMRDGLTFEDAVKEANRCLLCEDGPCSKGCPAGTNPAQFIRQIKFENYKGAARTIRKNNVMGLVCAYICPVEKLCQKACSIAALEDPINIAGLQRFACEHAQKLGLEPLKPSTKDQGKIAIIGAGPAGMSCAAWLLQKGYDVTLFEREKDLGGVARWYIPDYRLPVSAVTQDSKILNELGAVFKFGAKIDTLDDVKNILNHEVKAVFLGIGLSLPVKLSVFDGYENAVDYIRFLYDAKVNREKVKADLSGKRVVVIGGGSVAVDSACAAKALGAKNVTIVYRRSELEMPADKDEIELAHFMGINFKTNSQITQVVAHDGKITQVKGSEYEWLTQGSRNTQDAKPLAGSEFGLPADLVIQAIGTKRTQGFDELQVNDDFSTNIAGIYCGGDAANGGTTVAQAVGEGKQAALAIDAFVKNENKGA